MGENDKGIDYVVSDDPKDLGEFIAGLAERRCPGKVEVQDSGSSYFVRYGGRCVEVSKCKEGLVIRGLEECDVFDVTERLVQFSGLTEITSIGFKKPKNQ